jgi:hypothetical protein
VAVNRAAFPTINGTPTGSPGSLFVGGTEVFDSDSYGTSFVMPIDQNTPNRSGTKPFERVVAHVMEAQNKTEVVLNGISQGVIHAGDTFVANVDQGTTITSNRPVQVHLVSVDVGSYDEMRWYALAPRDDWSNDYYTPIEDSVGNTRVWPHNPNSTSITVSYGFL